MRDAGIRRWRVQAALVGLASPNGLSNGIVDFEDDELRAIVAMLFDVFTLYDREGVHDVGNGVARRREAGLEPRQVFRRLTLRRAPVAAFIGW